jgi:hypothetical protein
LKTHLAIPNDLDGRIGRYRKIDAGESVHRHAELEFEHVIWGRATMSVAGKRVEVGPRSLLWIFPHQPHRVLEQSDDFEMWIACFRRPLVRRAATSELTRPLRARRGRTIHCRTLPLADARLLCTRLADVSAYEDAALYNAGLGYLLLDSWLAYQQISERGHIAGGS